MRRLLIKNGFINIQKWWRGFVCLAIFSVVYLGLLLFYEVNDEINIGMYSKSDFDYIFQAISAEQVSSYSKEQSIEKISAFKSFTSMEISANNSRCTEVGVLAFDDLEEDVKNTFFSENRGIRVEKEFPENGVYVDGNIAEILNVSTGDTVEIIWDEMGSSLSYTIAGIYNPTTYVDKYTIMINWDNRTRELLEKVYGQEEWYSAAFISVADADAFEKYLEVHPYIPGQYIKDITMGLSKAESEEIINDAEEQVWDELIEKRSDTVDQYYESTIWNKTIKNIIKYGLAMVMLILAFMLVFVPYVSSGRKDSETLLLLGVPRKEINLCHNSILLIGLGLVYLGSVAIYYLLIVGFLFKNVTISDVMINTNCINLLIVSILEFVAYVIYQKKVIYV